MKSKLLGTVLMLGLLWVVGCNKTSPTAPTAPEIATTSAPSNPPSLEIVSFIATSQTIKRGTSTTLSWEVINSTGVELNKETVEAIGSKKVEPLENTTYVLEAIDSKGSISESIALIVENGADVVMVSGPTVKKWKDKYSRPGVFYFIYSGKIRNKGTYKASFVEIHVYTCQPDFPEGPCWSDNVVRIEGLHLEPKEESLWKTNTKRPMTAVDFSMTEYEITWSEHTETYTTGRMVASVWGSK